MSAAQTPPPWAPLPQDSAKLVAMASALAWLSDRELADYSRRVRCYLLARVERWTRSMDEIAARAELLRRSATAHARADATVVRKRFTKTNATWPNDEADH